ncbi:MAG: glucose-6-phosphate isomerase [Candidatus Aminicenantes bacterium]|nr:glucose-6-phosphate isomerase [Candidatus Aminicenantes bacterium]
MPEWLALQRHALEMRKRHLRDLFTVEPHRGRRFAVEAAGIYVDYSKNPVTAETMGLLFSLARSCRLTAERRRLFAGEKINATEARPVLHWALRDSTGRALMVDGVDVMPRILQVRERMAAVSEQVAAGERLGHGGRRLEHVVHLGIGGSDLGPRMACRALRFYSRPGLQVHFVSNLDPSHLSATLRDLSPENTLFIVASKTFSTQETMANAAHARGWLLKHFADEAAVRRHFLAVTAAPAAAVQWGIDEADVFEFWEWVGGRFSLPSAVGLPLMMAIGAEGFADMLRGFEAMDNHFRQAPLERNLPVILALLGIWHADFRLARTHAVVPYSQDLEHFPSYLQQLEMESNGKRVNRDGRVLEYATSPVLWGGTGTNAQHAFFQLLHQGTQVVPCDLIGFCRPLEPYADHHEQMLANLLAQGQALAFGKTRAELAAQEVPATLVPFREFSGDRPSTAILLEELTPAALGKLIALYEHKVFVQGVIWDILSFDQWGVELGKALARRLLPKLKGEAPSGGEDSSTRGLIDHCRKKMK